MSKPNEVSTSRPIDTLAKKQCRMSELNDLDLEDLCDECGHEIGLHDSKEGCTHEHGDRYESGYAPMAGGPCGCTAWEVEEVSEAEAKSEPGLWPHAPEQGL
jgi:hypothetical protein